MAANPAIQYHPDTFDGVNSTALKDSPEPEAAIHTASANVRMPMAKESGMPIPESLDVRNRT